jgi:hypothetical protein
MKLSLTALCFGSLLVFASRARAETGVPWDSGPSCESAQPTVPATLPANVPGIPIVGIATDVSLLALDGTTIPVEIGPVETDGYAIATWSASLAAGAQYTFRWSDGCGDGHEQTFVTTAAAPLPTAAGTISVARRSETLPCDSAGNPVGAVSADVHLTPSAELAPFMVIAATDLVVDPEPTWAYGRRYGDSSTEPVGVVSQKCPYGPRDFKVSARVRIPNGPTLTTESIDVSLPCPTTCTGEPDPSLDASAPGTGGSDSGLGASPDARDTTLQSRACSTSPGGRSPAALVLVAVGLASMGQAFRRRRR